MKHFSLFVHAWFLQLALLVSACGGVTMHDGYRWAIAGAGVAAGALRDSARAEGEAAIAGARSRDEALRRVDEVRARWREVASSARNASRAMQSLGAMNEQLDALVDRRFPRESSQERREVDAPTPTNERGDASPPDGGS